MCAQPGEVALGLFVVLAATDQRLHFGVPGLDADLQLQRAGRKTRDQCAQALGQAIGDQLEVRVHGIVGRRLDAPEEEAQDRLAGRAAQVEGAVDELEESCPALVQPPHLQQEALRIERHRGAVERGQAELAPERATARGFDIEDAMAQVVVAEPGVGRLQLVGCERLAGDQPRGRGLTVEHLPAQLRERHVAGAGDHEIGVAADRLRIGFVADFRAAQHQRELRRDAPQDGHQPRGFFGVPDVDPESDDPRRALENALGQRLAARADHELQDLAARLQRSHVRVQVAQPERCVAVSAVQRDEEDVGHGAHSVASPARRR